MKLIICICFLVLVILEEYQCDPCLEWLFGGNRNNDKTQRKKMRIDKHRAVNNIMRQLHPNFEDKQKHKYSPLPLPIPPSYPGYSQLPLGIPPSYPEYSPQSLPMPFSYPSQPYHPPASYQPYYTTSFGTYTGIPYGKQEGEWNGTPKYGRPRLSPTPIRKPHLSWTGTPNDSPNGTPAPTPVQTNEDTPQRKQYFVTPTGIQETPA